MSEEPKDSKEDLVDTTNEFMVASGDGGIVIIAFGKRLSHAQAIRLAAYLVVMSEWDFKAGRATEPSFERVVEAVRNT